MERSVFNVTKDTHKIDFKNQRSFRDPRVANGCVEVATSDGRVGTLSHLSINISTRHFAKDLRNLVGKDGVSVCLSGGFESYDSINLVEGLKQDLKDEGFKVSDVSNDVLGNCARRAEIFPDHVDVEKVDYADDKAPKKGILKLLFP
jgi:hypothetical protein